VLVSLGGEAELNDIYRAVEKIRAPLTKEWKSTLRCKLQQFSSDSQWWQKRPRNRADLFSSPRPGYWVLRPDAADAALLQQQVIELRAAFDASQAALCKEFDASRESQAEAARIIEAFRVAFDASRELQAAQAQTIAALRAQVYRLERRVRALRVLFFTAPPSRPSRRR
jgi:hypothetical protein